MARATPAAVVEHFDARFRTLGTAARATGAKAYMKSELAFHGVDAAQVRGECVAFCTAHPELAHDDLVAYVDALFATRAFDLRSVAIALLERFSLDHRSSELRGFAARGRRPKLLSRADLPWLVELARTGACWAHVDYLVTKVIGPLVEDDPAAFVRRHARDPDFWIRRVALLAQLRSLRGGGGDFALFAEIAAPMLGEREFFIRKAIGWVLREVSKKRPALVRDFLAAHGDACSGVTLREATKYLPAAMRPKSSARPRTTSRARARATR